MPAIPAIPAMRFVVCLVLALIAGGASAQSCSCASGSNGSLVTGQALTNLLDGKTVCVGSAPTWQHQEQHRAGGALWDYKRGPTDAVDKTAQLGTWSLNTSGANSAVTYLYTGGGSHTFKVCASTTAATYGFCPVGSNASSITFTTRANAAGGC